jgi:5-methylcytosine-specific restriction endonuclease McrA
MAKKKPYKPYRKNHWSKRNNERDSPLYSNFRDKVYARDKFKCVLCSCKRGLNAHHLNGWSWCISGRYEVSNAVTLCYTCHNKFHTEYGKGKNTVYQFDDFMWRFFKMRLKDLRL